MTGGQFWDDLNEDMRDPEFRAAYSAETRRIATDEYVRQHLTQYVVWVRDIPSGEDFWLIGPYRTEAGADKVAVRLRRNIAAVGADGVMDAGVAELRSGRDIMGVRDEMLTHLNEMGYVK